MATTISKPSYTTITAMLLGYEVTQATGNTFIDVLGRSDNDVLFAAAGLRTGTLTFGFETQAQAFACRDMYTSVGGKLTLADSDVPALGMVHVLSGNVTLTLDPDTRKRWTVAVDVTEVV